VALTDEANNDLFWYGSGAFFIFLAFACFLLPNASVSRAKAEEINRVLTTDHAKIIGLTALFVFWYLGAQQTCSSFIFEYATSVTSMGRKAADMLNSAFWGMLAVGRLIAIWQATVMTPEKMMLTNLLLCVGGASLALVDIGSISLMWAGTMTFGAFMASQFATAIVVAEKKAGRISGIEIGVFVTGSGLGQMIIPFVAATLFQHSARSLFYLLLACTCVELVLFVLLLYLVPKNISYTTLEDGLRHGSISEVLENVVASAAPAHTSRSSLGT